MEIEKIFVAIMIPDNGPSDIVIEVMLALYSLVADQIEHFPLLKSTIGQSMVYILYYQRQILLILICIAHPL